MLIFLLILIGAGVLLATLTGNSNKERDLNEYCKSECEQNIISKYKFCC